MSSNLCKASIENTIVVDPFIIHSESCNEYISYLISLDLHRCFSKHLNIISDNNDNRFVEIESLRVFIHDGVYKAIRYKAIAGHGYKLPRIHHYVPDE